MLAEVKAGRHGGFDDAALARIRLGTTRASTPDCFGVAMLIIMRIGDVVYRANNMIFAQGGRSGMEAMARNERDMDFVDARGLDYVVPRLLLGKVPVAAQMYRPPERGVGLLDGIADDIAEAMARYSRFK